MSEPEIEEGLEPSPEQDRKLDRWPPVVIWLGVFGILWLAFAQLFLSFPVLYDTDSYFHLSVGRLYADHGLVDELPWARFSALYEGFGDKEVLFHLFLAPFAAGDSPEVGGRWALAFWNALVVVVLAAVGRRLAGSWGLLAPLLVYAGSFDFIGRLIRLRPETPALLLFIAAALCVGHGRYRWLGFVAFVFTLSYTAFHALLGLCGLWFLQAAWVRGRIHPAMVLYPLLGAILALWVHPHFPHNLVIWKIQSLDFFQNKAVLDVGEEIASQPTDVVLGYNLPWLVAMAAIWLAAGRGGRLFAHGVVPAVERNSDGSPAEPDPDSSETDHEATREATQDALVLAACVFGVLYLLMLRFSTHFLPIATLAIFACAGKPSKWMPLPGRGRLPLVLVLVLALGAGGWRAGHLLSALAAEPADGSREEDWKRFGQSVPPGAKVAAWWGHTQTYTFFAPQGAYLNVLDPVFMAVPYPEVYEAQRQVFDGLEPDVPKVLVEQLDSEFLAASRNHRHPSLFERLRHDPRVGPRYQGHSLLFQLLPNRNEGFVLDWRRVPVGFELPVAPEAATSDWPQYPLATDARVRSVEGYVDARRFGDEPCVALVHDLQIDPGEAGVRTWELAPYGPTTLWLDGEPLVSTQASLQAFLGRGLRVSADLEAGGHRLTALTCRGEVIGEGASAYSGFYLLDRAP